MRFIRCGLLCLFLASAVAFAGGSIIANGTASLPNLTDSAANDLHVSLNAPVTVFADTSGVFTSVLPDDPSRMNWTLTGGSVAPTASVDLLWSRTGQWAVPQITSYYWTVDGTVSGGTNSPLYIDLAPSGSGFTLDLVNSTSADVGYAGLSLIADLALILDDVSGTVDANGRRIGPPFTPVQTYLYTVQDLSTGALVAGYAVDTVPEPATLAVAGLGLIGICALARHRSRRK